MSYEDTRCVWCRTRLPAPDYEIPQGFCSRTCYSAWHADVRQANVEASIVKRAARTAAGKAVCTARNNAGELCAAPPVRDSDRCAWHRRTTPAILTAAEVLDRLTKR